MDLFTHRWLPLSAKGTGRRVAENTKDDRSRTGSAALEPALHISMRLDMHDLCLWIGSCDLLAILLGHFERRGDQHWQGLWASIFGCDELARLYLTIGHNLPLGRVIHHFALSSL